MRALTPVLDIAVVATAAALLVACGGTAPAGSGGREESARNENENANASINFHRRQCVGRGLQWL